MMAKRQPTLIDISQNISGILGIEYNHSRLSIYRIITILCDLTDNVLHNTHLVSTGGYAEGTLIIGSDQDLMYVLPNIFAVRSSGDIPSDTEQCESYFKMEFSAARAGCCTLSVLKLYDNVLFEEVNLELSKCLKEYCNQKYLSSDSIIEGAIQYRNLYEKYAAMCTGRKDAYRHGPCATNTFKPIVDVPSDYVTTDFACAICCLSWPDAAMEWVSRRRRYGWPSKEMVENLSKMPCHLLAVGDSKSEGQDLQWRFAFVCQERELMWSFSSIQIQCYILLKTLRKVILPPIFHDEISSFHLKATMFWLIENEGPDMWTKENLLQCVINCLEKLKECIKAMNLSHFFLKDRNLFVNKMKNKECKRNLLSVLTQIQENIIQYVCSREVLSVLINFKENISQYIGMAYPDFMHPTSLETNLRNGSFILETYTKNRMARDQICKIVKYLPLFESVLMNEARVVSLLNLHQIISVKDLDKRYTRALKTFLLIRMAMEFHDDAQIAQDEQSKTKLLVMANGLFKDGCGLDGMAGHLYYATFDLVNGKVELAQDRVLALFQTDRCLYYCPGFSKNCRIIVGNGTVTQTVLKLHTNIKLHSDECLALNVHFISSDIRCVPDALKYECALLGIRNGNYNHCTIHPVAYSYFLLVTASQLQKNLKDVDRYLELFEAAVMNIIIFRYTALNLLGFAFYKAGKLEKAYTSFCQSLQERNSNKNAAVYHLCILVQDILSEKWKLH